MLNGKTPQPLRKEKYFAAGRTRVAEGRNCPCSGVDRFPEDRYLLDDFDIKALERRDVGWRVREQANFVDTEVGENLTAEADLAQDSLVAIVFG